MFTQTNPKFNAEVKHVVYYAKEWNAEADKVKATTPFADLDKAMDSAIELYNRAGMKYVTITSTTSINEIWVSEVTYDVIVNIENSAQRNERIAIEKTLTEATEELERYKAFVKKYKAEDTFNKFNCAIVPNLSVLPNCEEERATKATEKQLKSNWKAETQKLKFNMHNVRNLDTGKKCRVYYSLDNRVDERKCVTLYAKDYSDNLFACFPDSQNNTDSMTDYFEKDRVNLFENHPHYEAARVIGEKWVSKRG